jgi:rsbT co-antagonist protein RsbR
MLDQPQAAPRPLVITGHDIEERRRMVALDSDDIARVVALKSIVAPHVEQYTEGFFSHLRTIGAAAALFARPDALDEAKRRKREHLIAMVSGDYGEAYVGQRIALAMLYGKYGLEPRAFLGAFHHLMKLIGSDIMKALARDRADAFLKFMSMKKIGFFDIAIIIDVLIAERERTINLQQEAIRELSTPVLQVRDRLLVLPIIGVIDTQRAKQLTDALLSAIRTNRARVVVIDITGVAAVDSKVANHLIQTVAAARLMGSTVLVSGLSADVAQALVALGVDLGKINTVADLQGALEEGERMLGYRITCANETPIQPQSA